MLLAAALTGGLIAPASMALAQPDRPRTASKGPDVLKPALEADKLSKSGKLEEAGKKFESIWNDLRKQDPMFVGPSAPTVVEAIRSHCARSRTWRDRFRTLRDQAADTFDARGKQLADLAAWIVLNRIVDQDQKTLEWWDRVRKSPLARDVLTRFRSWLEPMLEREGRLGDLALAIDDPAALVRREYDGFRAAVRQDSSELNFRVAREVFLTRHARHYACLLLAGRERDATRLATEAMTVDHSPQMVACMVKAALECGKAARQHLDWLSAIDPNGESDLAPLRKQVEDVLAKTQLLPGNTDPNRHPAAGPITTAAAPVLPNIVPEQGPVER
jgi:hypothetical protein